MLSNILEKVAPCSMYVSSSDFEGISNSMLEALGMGLPTVVTDCPVGGARMVITSGEWYLGACRRYAGYV